MHRMGWRGELGGSHTHPYPGLLHIKGTVKEAQIVPRGSQNEIGGAFTLIPTQVSCILKGLLNKNKWFLPRSLHVKETVK
jgi:hypothetical protein